MSGITKIARLKKLKDFLVTIYIWIDSLDYNFLISTLEKYGFGKNFVLWVKVSRRDQDSCIINDGTTTR